MSFSNPSNPSKETFLVIAACLLALCAGCGPRPGSPYARLDSSHARLLSAQVDQAREALLREDLRGAFSGERPRNVLALSGGDADGAFGCGVLHGWRYASRCPRPTFDVVTGVSTGALIATFAFLGEERDDQTLHDVYTTVQDTDIYVGPFTPGPPNSVFDTGPLQRLIAQFNIREIAHVARSNDPPFQFRFMSIPDEVDDAPGPSLLPRMFDAAIMTRLYETGAALGRQTPGPWKAEPPKLDNDP